MIIAVAIPFFFLFIGIEVALIRWGGARGRYRFADALTDLGCGVLERIGGAFYGFAKLAVYVWLYEHARVVELPVWAQWTLAMIGVDFGYYWWHRMSHRVNFVWAAHVVHHQSNDYNLAVALRQTIAGGLTSWLFYLWMAPLGVPPLVFGAAGAINLLYQFFIHTEVVDKLPGPIEYVFNTPSHHRVHHGVNAAYVDKNYGGIFILFDRWFGTFEPERDPVVYGTITRYASWNPIWSSLDWWAHLASVAAQAPRWSDKLWIWFAPPEFVPEGVDLGPKPTDAELRARPVYDVDAPKWWAYITAQWAPYIGMTMAVLVLEEQRQFAPMAALAAMVLPGLAAHGALLERRGWAVPLEAARLLIIAGIAGGGAAIGAVDARLGAAGVAWALASAVALIAVDRAGGEVPAAA